MTTTPPSSCPLLTLSAAREFIASGVVCFGGSCRGSSPPRPVRPTGRDSTTVSLLLSHHVLRPWPDRPRSRARSGLASHQNFPGTSRRCIPLTTMSQCLSSALDCQSLMHAQPSYARSPSREDRHKERSIFGFRWTLALLLHLDGILRSPIERNFHAAAPNAPPLMMC